MKKYPNFFLKKPEGVLGAMNAALESEAASTHIMLKKKLPASEYNN